MDGEGRLVEPGDLVDASPGVEREFVAPLLEIKTSPCESTAELRDELFTHVERVLRRADDLDRKLVPLATPLGDEAEVRERSSDRTRIQNRVVGEPFEYVRHCAGTHVHVEQLPGRETDQLNTLVAIDPALALVNSAPYFRGRRLAAGARSMLYRRMAYDDLSHQGRLWSYVADADEWNRRLERRYEEFVTAAVEAGVDHREIEANFDPESAAWTPVKLRDSFDTVEWRSLDAALPNQMLRLAEDLVRIVDRLRDPAVEVHVEGDAGRVTPEAIVLPEFDAVIDRVDAAIREGLRSPAVCSYLDRMGFDSDAYDPVSHEIDGYEELTPEAARDLRLEHAERLERDVQRMRPARGD